MNRDAGDKDRKSPHDSQRSDGARRRMWMDVGHPLGRCERLAPRAGLEPATLRLTVWCRCHFSKVLRRFSPYAEPAVPWCSGGHCSRVVHGRSREANAGQGTAEPKTFLAARCVQHEVESSVGC